MKQMKSSKPPVAVPAISISRLSLYARRLATLERKGVEMVTSSVLADACGVNSPQVRNDLSYFGGFGVKGVGYYVGELLFEIRKILGLDKQWRLGLIGVGDLGTALLKQNQFANDEYAFVAACDKDPKQVSRQIGEITIEPFDSMERAFNAAKVEIGVINISHRLAQKVADKLIKGVGVRGILNFSAADIQCPKHVFIENVDFTLSLDKLCYRLTSSSPR